MRMRRHANGRTTRRSSWAAEARQKWPRRSGRNESTASTSAGLSTSPEWTVTPSPACTPPPPSADTCGSAAVRGRRAGFRGWFRGRRGAHAACGLQSGQPRRPGADGRIAGEVDADDALAGVFLRQLHLQQPCLSRGALPGPRSATAGPPSCTTAQPAMCSCSGRCTCARAPRLSTAHACGSTIAGVCRAAGQRPGGAPSPEPRQSPPAGRCSAGGGQ